MTICLPDQVQTDPEPPRRHRLELRAHRRLRGPYAAGGALLRQIIPELMTLDPELVRPAATAVVAIAPDLHNVAPLRPHTLTDLADGDERTRFYGLQRTRDLAFMVSQVVNVWARVCHPEGVTLRFHELAHADATDSQLVRTLARRCVPELVIERVDAADEGSVAPDGCDLAQVYINDDGTSDDAGQLAAYEALEDADRRARHSRRGSLLVELSPPGAALGAIPYHLERGLNPSEAAPWLVAAQNQAFREGFYEAALDFGQRGRALILFEDDAKTHNYLTKRVIGAMTYLSRCDDAMALIDEHRRMTTEVAEQMNDAYMMAMIYTRHITPKRIDQDLALSWVNTALALAEGAHDPERYAFFGAFMRNARALIELHRGNLVGSLDLVNQAIEIADEHLDPEQHQLHRTVLINNRARLLLGMKDYSGALAGFDEVITRDPEYDEPHFERAAAHKACGNFEAALADLGRAVELSVAFSDAYYNRADILLDLGETEAALLDLDAVLDIDPDYLEALVNRAALRIEFGDLDAASADLEHGLELAPRNAHLWSAKGRLCGERGTIQEALDCFETALTIDPRMVEVYGNRAVMLFTSGRVEESVADLDRALALTDTAALRLNRAIARQELGEPAAAISDIDAALLLADVDIAEALFRRGISRHALGRDDLAKADWEEHRAFCAEVGEPCIHEGELSFAAR